MDKEYRVNLNLSLIETSSEVVPPEDFEFYLLVLSYMIQAQDISSTNNWISEKSLKGGKLFFQGIHQLPFKSLITIYGKKFSFFEEAGVNLGGKRVDYGDIAFEFQLLPRIPLICILWVEDDEFPARISYLFDSSIEEHFNLDLILAMVNQFSLKMKDYGKR
jgi:hypothetical protein